MAPSWSTETLGKDWTLDHRPAENEGGTRVKVPLNLGDGDHGQWFAYTNVC